MSRIAVRTQMAAGALFDPVTSINWHSLFYASGPEMGPLYADGAAISAWPDEVSARSAVQATGTRQPAWRASVAALNNKPAIQGDGVDDRLVVTFTPAIGQPYTVVAIGSFSSTTKTMIDGVSASGRFNRSAAGLFAMVGGGSITTAATPGTTPHLFRGFWNGASSTAVMDETNPYGGNAGANQNDGFTIGCRADGANVNGGHVALVGLYEGDLTAHGQWAAFKTWITSFYGITLP